MCIVENTRSMPSPALSSTGHAGQEGHCKMMHAAQPSAAKHVWVRRGACGCIRSTRATAALLSCMCGGGDKWPMPSADQGQCGCVDEMACVDGQRGGKRLSEFTVRQAGTDRNGPSRLNLSSNSPEKHCPPRHGHDRYGF